MLSRIDAILERAKSLARPARLIVAGSTERTVLESACQAQQMGLANVTLVGPRQETLAAAARARLSLDRMNLIDAGDNAEVIALACGALRDGQADLFMKGDVPTDEVMRTGVLDRQYGLRTDRILSHVAVFEAPNRDRLALLTDAGVNIAPDITRKIDIIHNAVEVAAVLGIDTPRVALLAASEKAENSAMPAVRDASLLVGMNRAGRLGDCVVAGPLSLDLAVSSEAARRKGMTDPVTGNADILVAHDINVGNALFKALQTWVGATIASVVVGASVPLVVPSRADSEPSKLSSIALAVLLWARGPAK